MVNIVPAILPMSCFTSQETSLRPVSFSMNVQTSTVNMGPEPTAERMYRKNVHGQMKNPSRRM